MADARARSGRWAPWLPWLALFVLCASLFCCTAPGRITYPDDEIVFRTTQSLVERGSLAVEPIAKRTGEREDRPTGTFGWAEGRDNQRYGFFGHGQSLVAVPLYLLARATVDRVPELWRYALRSDLFTFHRRGPEADWLRLVVSLTNSLLTPLGAVLLGLWLRVLGHGPRPALLTALVYALATTAWPYAGTFLSEPLSVIVLLGAALEISRWHRDRRAGDGRPRHLWIAATLAGLSVHVHVLNLIALPCLWAYAHFGLEPAAKQPGRRDWILAFVFGAAGLALLGLSQWWRFGDPFETGRYDHYGRWVWPFEGMATMLVAPGRSLLLYSPPLVLGLIAWPALRRRDPATAWLCLALAASRWIFVACRSDWHGGWAIGPRYLVPVVPFLLVPLAGLFERWAQLRVRARVGIVALIAASVVLQAWLALHSIFQVFWQLNVDYGRERYMAIADWKLWATPPWMFWQEQQPALNFWREGQARAAMTSAKFDALGFGAWRLAKMTEADGLWWILLGVGALGLVAAAVLVAWLARGALCSRRR